MVKILLENCIKKIQVVFDVQLAVLITFVSVIIKCFCKPVNKFIILLTI